MLPSLAPAPFGVTTWQAACAALAVVSERASDKVSKSNGPASRFAVIPEVVIAHATLPARPPSCVEGGDPSASAGYHVLRTWGNAATLATADVADELADARRSLARRNCAEASEGGRLSKGPRLRAETPHSGVQARALPVGLQSFLLVTLIMDPPPTSAGDDIKGNPALIESLRSCHALVAQNPRSRCRPP